MTNQEGLVSNGLEDPREAKGNGTVILVLDSGDNSAYRQARTTIVPALNHFGIPYSVLDLADEEPAPDSFNGAACILIGQAYIGRRVLNKYATFILDAVKEGAGLVNLDHDIAGLGLKFQGSLSLSVLQNKIKRGTIRTANCLHPITSLRDSDQLLDLYEPVEVTVVPSLQYRTPEHGILQTMDGLPVLIVNDVGAGRVVQFSISPDVWKNEILGHASGLDDVLWRSIVWASRKPFAMYSMPPFVTVLIDDCSSSYDHFGYVDVFNRHGYLPHLELFLREIDKVRHETIGLDSKEMKAKYDSGLADFAAHAFSYDDHIYFDHDGKTRYPDNQVQSNFELLDQFFNRWNIAPSHFLNAHFGEVGINALPFLRERGIVYYGGINQFGVSWFGSEEEKAQWQPAPYGRKDFIIDYMPNHPEFFAIKAQLEPREYTVEPRVDADALWNHTIFWNENSFNDIEAAAQQAARQIRRGLDSLFFGCLMTHEQRISVISRKELDTFLTRLDALTDRYQKFPMLLGQAAEYAYNRHRAQISIVNHSGEDQRLACSLQGSTGITTFLRVFSEKDGALHDIYIDVPPFEGWTTINVNNSIFDC